MSEVENLKVHLMVEAAREFGRMHSRASEKTIRVFMLAQACELDATAREFREAWYQFIDPPKAPDTLRPGA